MCLKVVKFVKAENMYECLSATVFINTLSSKLSSSNCSYVADLLNLKSPFLRRRSTPH